MVLELELEHVCAKQQLATGCYISETEKQVWCIVRATEGRVHLHCVW